MPNPRLFIRDLINQHQYNRILRLDQVLPLPPATLPAWHGIQDAIEPEPDGPPTY
jgi:hypothetical protein